MPHHYAVGTPVQNPPQWLAEIVGQEPVAYLERGVCEICEIYGFPRWIVGRHGYVYCQRCIEGLDHPHEKWVLLGQ
jgi:hypothetical protein